MELQEVHGMEVLLEDALIELKISEPQKKELKKEVKNLKGLIKSLLKVVRSIESSIDDFGTEGVLSIDEAKNYADVLEELVKFCLGKYEKVRKLLEEERR